MRHQLPVSQYFSLMLLAAFPGLCTSTSLLRIHVYDYVTISPALITFGETEAARLFAPAGIRIQWINCRMGAQSCPDEWIPGDLRLNITRENMPRLSPKAFGATIWHGRDVSATILYDRVAAARRGGATFTILGKTITHEIGHLLLGPDSHSATGIMRPLWNTSDFDFEHEPLWFFTSTQRCAIRSEVAQHSAAALSAAAALHPNDSAGPVSRMSPR